MWIALLVTGAAWNAAAAPAPAPPSIEVHLGYVASVGTLRADEEISAGTIEIHATIRWSIARESPDETLVKGSFLEGEYKTTRFEALRSKEPDDDVASGCLEGLAVDVRIRARSIEVSLDKASLAALEKNWKKRTAESRAKILPFAPAVADLGRTMADIAKQIFQFSLLKPPGKLPVDLSWQTPIREMANGPETGTLVLAGKRTADEKGLRKYALAGEYRERKGGKATLGQAGTLSIQLSKLGPVSLPDKFTYEIDAQAADCPRKGLGRSLMLAFDMEAVE